MVVELTQSFVALDFPVGSCRDSVYELLDKRLNASEMSPEQDGTLSSVQVDVQLDAQRVTYFPL